MTKRKNLATILILGFITTVIAINSAGCGAKEEKSTQKESDKKIVCDNIKEFKKNASEGVKCVLRTSGIEGHLTDQDIVYDGENFFRDGEKTEKYSYIVELEGRLRNAAVDLYMVVLANKDYSWEEYVWLEYKNQSFDSEGIAIYDDYSTIWEHVTNTIILR